MPALKEVATFGDKEDGTAGRWYRVVGWKRENWKGKVVNCTRGQDPDYAVLTISRKKKLAPVERLRFCPECQFLGKISP